MQRLTPPGWWLTLTLVLALTLAGGVIAATPDTVEIAWWTIDGGGGSASGGGYTLDGTIGQPDADSASGSRYVLESGFWTAQATVSSYRLFTPLVAR